MALMARSLVALEGRANAPQNDSEIGGACLGVGLICGAIHANCRKIGPRFA